MFRACIVFCLMFLSGQAFAAFTYQFTATVQFGTGTYSTRAAGEALTGSFTIDTAAPSAINSGTVGDASGNWVLAYNSFPACCSIFAPPSSNLFTQVLSGAGVSYSTALSYAQPSASSIQGTLSGGYNYTLAEAAEYSSSRSSGSYIQLIGPVLPWTATGELLTPVNYLQSFSALGVIQDFNAGTQSELHYSITSISPGNSLQAVPIPAAAWLMLSGLGAFGAAARRRKAA